MRRSGSKRKDRPLGKDHAEAFIDHLRSIVGTEAQELERSLGTPSPVSIRFNAEKWKFVSTDPVPWCETGSYLKERPAFTFDPLFHAGCYYVQEPSSMLLEQAFHATGLSDKDIIALDLCAAPGGKTTHLRSLLSSNSLLVANEIDRKRQVVLQENLWKWGAAQTVVSGSAPKDLLHLPEFFDLIVVDAPCSGEGMFRKDPFARQQWSPALVQQCTIAQTGILDRAWDALKPGGFIIYSTCTWETAENEGQVAKLIEQGGEAIPIPVDPNWGVSSSQDDLGIRCYPHKTRGEGFFIAAIRKPGSLELDVEEQLPIGSGERSELLDRLNADRPWELLDQEHVKFAIAPRWSSRIRSITDALRVLSPGIPIAELKGNEWRPHIALALANDRACDVFQEIALSGEQVLDYLRGNALPAIDAHGNGLVTYNGHGLGWVRGAGTRWNNLLPAKWRIKAQEPLAPNVPWART